MPENDIRDTYLHTFLGTSRWQNLARALKMESRDLKLPSVGFEAVILSLLVAGAPIGISAMNQYCQQDLSDLSTVTFGISALLALLFCSRIRDVEARDTRANLPFRAVLSNTHTAFALGCIPAVLILASNPQILAERSDIIRESIASTNSSDEATTVFGLNTLPMIVALTVWIAVTEEYIYRGMLVGCLRRVRWLNLQLHRDILAVSVSSLIFGFAHYFSWGLLPAIALCGIGVGLGLGFIASQEKLGTLILYHFLFDTLSIGLNVMLALIK